MAGYEQAAPPARPRRRRSVPYLVFRGCVLGLVLALAAEAFRVLLGSNFHTVLPGRVYRGSQQSGAGLEQLIRAHNIRTVINLRGSNAVAPWYLEEARTTQRLAICQEDICFSAGRLPSIHEVRRLVDVLDHTAYPILLHCRRGADRTGLASAVIALLQTDMPLERARAQLGLRYGHVAFGRPAFLDLFLDQYEDWLGEHGLAHSPTIFRRWITREYKPAGYDDRVELLDAPTALPRGRCFVLRFRAHNTGTSPWCLRPDNNAGVHLGFVVWDRAGNMLGTGRAGLYDAVVAPGESIDFTLALPPLPGPGPYRLFVDMVDEQQLWFYQTGSEPWEREFEVHDEDAAAGGKRNAAGLAGLAH
jgi:hypothetical protein